MGSVVGFWFRRNHGSGTYGRESLSRQTRRPKVTHTVSGRRVILRVSLLRVLHPLVSSLRPVRLLVSVYRWYTKVSEIERGGSVVGSGRRVSESRGEGHKSLTLYIGVLCDRWVKVVRRSCLPPSVLRTNRY